MTAAFQNPCRLPVVVASELGCQTTGLVFSFCHEPMDVSVFRLTDIASRFPMSFLFTEDKNLDCFGLEAEDKYSKLNMKDKHQGWFFFRNLDTEPVGATLNDVNGKAFPTKKIFSSMIRYFHDGLMNLFQNRDLCFGNSDVCLVISIPEYWTYRSKCFILDAAHEAGIARESFRIVSRSLAQLAYCRTVPDEGTKERQAKNIIIIDLEESTAEVHVYEKQADGTFTSTAHGIKDTRTVACKRQIEQWLKDTLGCHVYDKIYRESPVDIHDFENELEMKLGVHKFVSKANFFNVKTPVVFKETYEEMTGKAMKTAFGVGVEQRGLDKLRLPKTFLEDICRPYIACVASMLLEVLQDIEVQGPSTLIYFVGTISTNNLVIEAIREILTNSIRGVSMVIVEKPEFAALRGSVMKGHAYPPPPLRVSKYTYGVETGRLLKTIIKRGQDVSFGVATTSIIVPTKVGQSQIVFTVIATTRDRPLFKDPATDKRVGTFTIDVPSSATSRKVDIEISMEVAQAELIVTAKEKISKRCYVRKYAF